jgi:putative ABC transport system permease protein
VTLVSRGITTDYRVTGIAKDPPKNSHVEFTMIGRVDFPTYYSDTKEFLDSWGWQSGWFYFTLKPGTDAAELQKALPAWEKRNIPTQQFGQIKFNAGDQQDWKIENVRDVHLGEAQDGAMRSGNDRRSIATFAIIAVLILGMACINFTNLATARASQRAREVALRKVLGANRSQLIVQFLAESILVAAFAMLLALALVEFLLPPLSGFLDADLSVSYFGSEGLLLPILTMIIVVGAAGGIYPAFYLSRFQPAQVLKANKSSAEAAGSGRLRGALVIGQFAVSIGLIICTAVVYGQTVYARSVDPGYKRDGLIQVSAFGRRQMLPLAETMVREMKRVDGVVSVGRTGIGVATQNNSNTGVQVPGRAEPVTLGQYSVDNRLFRDDGHQARRRTQLRGRSPGRRHDSAGRSRSRVGAGAGEARRQHRRQRAGSETDGLRQPTGRDRQNGQGCLRERGAGGARAGDHHRRSPGQPLPLRPATDRSDPFPLREDVRGQSPHPLCQCQSCNRDGECRGGLEAGCS